MRRLFFASTAVGLLGLALGCHHMHGVCDCDQGTDWCGYYNTCTPVAVHSAPPPIAAPAAPVGSMAMPSADQGREKLPPPAEKEK